MRNVMQYENDTTSMAVLLTERLCALPAVATTTWPDSAASALARIATGSLAWVMIAQLDAHGDIISREAAGVGSTAPSNDRARLLTLRSAVERVPGLGFAPSEEDLNRGVAGEASRLYGAEWARAPIARAWTPDVPDAALIGVASLGGVDPRRALVVGIGIPAGGPDPADAARLLSCTLPVLIRRAVLAIGSRPSTSSRWLTDREQIVLERLALGRSVREIAEEIDRSPHTVHDHVKSLHRKLNASSRGELVARALGYIDDDHRVVGALTPGMDAALKPRAEAGEPVASENNARGGHPSMHEPKPATHGTAVRLAQ